MQEARLLRLDGQSASEDLFLAQRFARHASPLTTLLHTHAADEELWEAIRDSPRRHWNAAPASLWEDRVGQTRPPPPRAACGLSSEDNAEGPPT